MTSESKDMNNYKIIVNVEKQKLIVQNASDSVCYTYPVSTSSNGIGNTLHSGKTPLGSHEIVEKYGDEAPLGTIFKNRINTGNIAKINTDSIMRETDLVTTRILRLSGLEPKINSNSYIRYIYIHGTPEEGMIGKAASHGCIRMKNKDIIELYNIVGVGTKVFISPK